MQAQRQTVAERSDRRRDRRSHIWDLLGDIRGGGGLVASTEILLVRSGRLLTDQSRCVISASAGRLSGSG